MSLGDFKEAPKPKRLKTTVPRSAKATAAAEVEATLAVALQGGASPAAGEVKICPAGHKIASQTQNGGPHSLQEVP